MDILDDMRVSKLSAKVFFKMNYSFSKDYIHLSVHVSSQCINSF